MTYFSITKAMPLPADASPIAASPDYVADSDPEEDLEDDQADYPVDGGDGDDDEPSDDDDDDDTDDEDQEDEPFEEDGGEEEEHSALADSSAVPIGDLIGIMSQGYKEPVMSDVSSVVTYTSVYTDSEPWRYYGEDSAKTGPPRVIVYEYDGLPIQSVAPPSPDYVPGPKHPPSPNYVSGLEHPPSPIEIPYVPEPEYPEYLALFDDGAPLEDQPLPADASPIAASPDYTGCISFTTTTCTISTITLPSPLTTSLTDTGAPLGYRAARIRMRALLPSTSRRTNIPEADMPPWKKACLTAPASRFEIGESYAAGDARQPGPTESDLRRCRVEQAGYGITDTWDEIVYKMIEIAPTTLEGVNERVIELDTTVRQRTDEFDVCFEDAQFDRALMRARVNTLFWDRPDHHRTAMLMDKEAMYSREA
nr:hypothetical protein [Tanacetum cinerariifolium]